jgi:arylsulfatase A-like enzyme
MQKRGHNGIVSSKLSRRQVVAGGGAALLAGCADTQQGEPTPGTATTSETSESGSDDGRPNVLFLMCDDLRPELNCYGQDHISSPNIDRLAEDGALFERAYSQVPTCGPSRASMLSGLRVDDIAWRTEELPFDFTSMPGHFTDSGFHTVEHGKITHHIDDLADEWSEEPWRTEKRPLNDAENFGEPNSPYQKSSSAQQTDSDTGRGPYAERADVPDDAYEDGRLATRTIEKIDSLAGQEEPFFLAAGTWRPHLPLNAPARYWERYDREDIELPEHLEWPNGITRAAHTPPAELKQYGGLPDDLSDPEFVREARHAYYACVSYADAQIGRVLDALEENDLADNTIVVLTSDHGWQLGERGLWGKHNLVELSLRVPLIIRGPGIDSGVRSDAVVELLDLYPTLCDLTGVEQPEHLDGQSVAPAAQGESLEDSGPAYSFFRNGRSIITDQYHYAEWGDGNANMLFDLENDPREDRPLSDNDEYADVVADMRERLRTADIRYEPPELTAKPQSWTEIALEWTEGPGADGYRVQRRTAGGDEWTTIAEGLSATEWSYVDDGVSAGTTYEYRVVPTSGGETKTESSVARMQSFPGMGNSMGDSGPATWIWYPEFDGQPNGVGGLPSGNLTRYFRRTVDLPADRTVATAVLVTRVDNRSETFLNGTSLGTSEHWEIATVYDVTSDVRDQQRLALGIDATFTHGWAGVVGRLAVRFENGETMVVNTDDSWNTSKTADDGWTDTGFDDSGWKSAKEYAAYPSDPWGVMGFEFGGQN